MNDIKLLDPFTKSFLKQGSAGTHPRLRALHPYENVTIGKISYGDDVSKASTGPSTASTAAEPASAVTVRQPHGKKKLASSRRTLWLQRRRSRSIDSSDVLCDYSSIKKSSKLTAIGGSADSSSFDSSEGDAADVYEDAVDVSLIKGVSIKNNPSILDKKKWLAESRNCMSMNDIDYENVRLQHPEAASTASAIQENVYDDPWNTADTLNMILRRRSIVANDRLRQASMTDIEGGELVGLLPDLHLTHNIPDLSNPRERPTFKVNTKLPLLQQSWYHDEMSREEADTLLNAEPVGAFVVRINSLQKKDLTLSVRTISGVVHLRAVRQIDCRYILGQFSEPFQSAAAMIRYYSVNELKINGAPHTYLTLPINCADIM